MEWNGQTNCVKHAHQRSLKEAGQVLYQYNAMLMRRNSTCEWSDKEVGKGQ